MITNKLRLVLSAVGIVWILYVFITGGKSSFIPINIGLFIIFITSFITSLSRQMKDKK